MKFRRSNPPAESRRSTRSFRSDDRAIEGLPIRLVIALVVGVMALGFMTQMLGGLSSIGKTEVNVQYPDGSVAGTDDSNPEITIAVYSEDGQPVENARILVSAGTAQLDETISLSTGSDSHKATLDFDDDLPSGTSIDDLLRSDQNKATLKVEIIPPSDSNWADNSGNTEIVVIEGSSS